MVKAQLHFGKLLFLVLAVLIVLLVTLGPNPEHSPKRPHQVKLIPFHHVSALARLSVQPELPLNKIRSHLIDLFGNISLFMPFGAAISLMLGWNKRVTRTQLLISFGFGLLFSLSVETIQLWSPSRVADIDDVIFNSTGSILGAMFIPLVYSSYSQIRLSRYSRRVQRLFSLA